MSRAPSDAPAAARITASETPPSAGGASRKLPVTAAEVVNDPRWKSSVAEPVIRRGVPLSVVDTVVVTREGNTVVLDEVEAGSDCVRVATSDSVLADVDRLRSATLQVTVRLCDSARV